MTFIPTPSGFMRLEDSEKLLRLSSQTIPACNRVVPHRVWSRPTKAAQIGGISHVPDHC